MTDTPDVPDPTPDPNKPPESQVPPIQPPSQRLPAFFQIPPLVPTPQPETQPQAQIIPGVIAHPNMEHMVEISAHAGIVQICIRPSGAWMRVPCNWIPQLITRIEAARDAAALMQSAIEQGTGSYQVKRS